MISAPDEVETIELLQACMGKGPRVTVVIDTRGHNNDAQPGDVNEEGQDQSDQDHS